jgi:hypothetical protein
MVIINKRFQARDGRNIYRPLLRLAEALSCSQLSLHCQDVTSQEKSTFISSTYWLMLIRAKIPLIAGSSREVTCGTYEKPSQFKERIQGQPWHTESWRYSSIVLAFIATRQRLQCLAVVVWVVLAREYHDKKSGKFCHDLALTQTGVG